MAPEHGRIQKKERLSPRTEFKAGSRGWKACHDADWLRYRHWDLGQSVTEMGRDPKCNCTAANIRFWMKKLGVARRPEAEAAAELKGEGK